MAKKSSIEKNNKRIALSARHNDERLKLKSIIKDENVSWEEKLEAQRKMQALPKNSSPVRVRNRCAITGRPRGFLGMFGVSRIKFRELALQGVLPGVKKASW